MSALQLQRELLGENEETKKVNGSYRTSWFMCHGIRWAMTHGPMTELLKGVIEADETYVEAVKWHGDPNRQLRSMKIAILGMCHIPAKRSTSRSRSMKLCVGS